MQTVTGRTLARTCIAATLSFGFALIASAVDIAGSPMGLDAQVNQVLRYQVRASSIAMDAQGRYVVVWVDGELNLGSCCDNAIKARRYDATGAPLGDEFQVNTNSSSIQSSNRDPKVAMTPNGSFIVTWAGGSFADPAGVTVIHARRYDPTGEPIDSGFEVEPIQANFAPNPEVAIAPDGRFAFAWLTTNNNVVLAKQYDSNGAATGPAFQVSTTGPDCGIGAIGDPPDVALHNDGRMVVVWAFKDPCAQTDWRIFARSYASNGVAEAGEVTLASNPHEPAPAELLQPTVAVQPGGGFVAYWQNNAAGATQGRNARTFGANGLPVSDVIVVANYFGNALETNIAADAYGRFAVAVANAPVPEGSGMQNVASIRRYAADGTPLEGVVLASEVFDALTGPTFQVATDADGDTVAAWVSVRAEGGGIDPELNGHVVARKFGGFEDVDLAIDKSDSEDPVLPGAVLSYTMNVTNNHGAATPTGIEVIDEWIGVADRVTVTDTLPEGAGYLGFSGPGWDCSESGGIVSCGYSPHLPPGGSASVIIDTTAPNGDAFNTASVAAAQYDSVTANNSAGAATHILDTVPDQFTFGDLTGKITGTEYPSNLVTIAGLEAEAPVSVVGGRYSKNGGAFTTDPGTALNGDTLRLRLFSSPDANSTTNATLTVGGVSDTFSVTTGSSDTTAAPFTFTDQVDVPPGTARTSNPITVSGINAPATISIIGGRYRINGIGSYVSTPGTVNLGDSIRVLHTSASTPLTSVDTTLNIGGMKDTFTSTTNTDDVNPDAFGFGPTLKNQAVSTLVESIIITPIGYDAAAPVKALAGTEYSINGGAYTAAAGTISPGDTLRVRHVTASTANTVRKTGIKIGTTAGYFFTRTAP